MEKSTFVIDVDGTICVAPKIPGTDRYDYANAAPIQPVIEKIRELKSQGHTVILHTSRGMRTYRGDREMIEIEVRPVLYEWLQKHNVPHDALHMGKPWGPNVYYIDDRAVSPIDFAYNEADAFEVITNLNKIHI